MSSEILQLGATFIIALGLIELVKFVISKYTVKQNNNWDKKMYEEVSNHMATQIDNGFDRLEKSITEMHRDMAEKLTEIATLLKHR